MARASRVAWRSLIGAPLSSRADGPGRTAWRRRVPDSDAGQVRRRRNRDVPARRMGQRPGPGALQQQLQTPGRRAPAAPIAPAPPGLCQQGQRRHRRRRHAARPTGRRSAPAPAAPAAPDASAARPGPRPRRRAAAAAPRQPKRGQRGAAARLAARCSGLQCTKAAVHQRQGSRQASAGCQSSAAAGSAQPASAPTASRLHKASQAAAALASVKDAAPQGQHGVALGRRSAPGSNLRRLLVQPRHGAARGAVRGRRRRQRGRRRPAAGRRPRRAAAARCCRRCRAAPAWVGGMRQHQVLHRELDVHHAAGAVLDVEAARPAPGVRCAHLVAHRAHLVAQRGGVARRGQHGAPHGLEARRRSPASPAQKRARVMAWCSQVQAVLLPRPTW